MNEEMNNGHQSTIHIIGDAFVDLFCFLESDWPKIGGDARLKDSVAPQAGGSAVNTATHLRSLAKDQRVILHTVLNESDEYGKMLKSHTDRYNIPVVNYIPEKNAASTGHCIVIVSRNERSFMTHLGCVENFSAEIIDVSSILNTPNPVHVHISGFFNLPGFWHGGLSRQLEILRKQKNMVLSLVPQHDATNQWDGGIDDVIKLLDVLILNELEANHLVNRKARKIAYTDPAESWAQFFSEISLKVCVVITRGSQGAVAVRGNQVVAQVQPAVEVPVVDPTGAGDAFCAGFMHGIHLIDEDSATLSKESIREGLLWGCATGTAACQVRGASVPSEIGAVCQLYSKLKTNIVNKTS